MPGIRVLLATLLAGLGGAAFAQPTDTPTLDQARAIIADLNRIVAPTGIDESHALLVGGIPQWVHVRGQDVAANPLLLFVHGGPASPAMPTAWQFQRPIEEYFTVVQWDQRGAGKTYAETDEDLVRPTLTVERYVRDIIELTQVLRDKYRKRKVVLVAHSWGTIIALKAVHRRPDLFHAYVGIGQVIDGRANEALSFRYGYERAAAEGNVAALREMDAIAPYPGTRPLTRDRIVVARKWPQHYGGLSAHRSDSKYYFQGGRLSPDYSSEQLQAIDKGSRLTLDRVIDAILNADLTTIDRLEVPVVMFHGRHDYTTPTAPVEAWMRRLEAPSKKEVWFEHSAHMAPWEEPGKTLMTLVQDVRPLAAEETPRP